MEGNSEVCSLAEALRVNHTLEILVLALNKIGYEARGYEGKNYWGCSSTQMMGVVKNRRVQLSIRENCFRKCLKMAIHENCAPRKFGRIWYL